MAAYHGFVTHVTCRLTAKNRDQLRNPTLGNRVWATFTFTSLYRVSQKVGPQTHDHDSVESVKRLFFSLENSSVNLQLNGDKKTPTASCI